MPAYQTIDVPVAGMDCADCTHHVQVTIAVLPGVRSVTVFLASEKAILELDPSRVDLPTIAPAVRAAGYSVPELSATANPPAPLRDFTRSILTLFGLAFGAILFVTVVGEWLGLFDLAMDRVPWPVWLVVRAIGGFPVFRNVLRAAVQGRVISHTLMTVGVLAAVAVGQWTTAIVVVFFMRVGDFAERFTTEKGRRALRDLTALAPQTARVERDGAEVEIPIDRAQVGDTVVVRPGEKIPVDGQVVDGQATVDQAAITGESMPVEVGPGSRVFAAALTRLGSVRVRTTGVGADTTFGRVIALVEQAEANRGDVQRVADKFSTYRPSDKKSWAFPSDSVT